MTSNDPAALHDLAAAYALDALDVADQAAFETHLTGCRPCREEVAGFAETMAMLAKEDQVAPAPAVRDQVLSRITEVEQVPAQDPEQIQPDDQPRQPGTDGPAPEAPVAEPIALAGRRRWSRLGPMLAAAAVFVIAGLGLTLLGGGDDRSVEDLVAAPDALTTELEDIAVGGAGGQVTVVFSAQESKAAVIGVDLAQPEPGLAYALWAVNADGAVAPAGLFDVEDGRVEVVLDVGQQDPDGWGITIEPDSGSPQPTTDILYLTTG